MYVSIYVFIYIIIVAKCKYNNCSFHTNTDKLKSSFPCEDDTIIESKNLCS